MTYFLADDPKLDISTDQLSLPKPQICKKGKCIHYDPIRDKVNFSQLFSWTTIIIQKSSFFKKVLQQQLIKAERDRILLQQFQAGTLPTDDLPKAVEMVALLRLFFCYD